MFKIMCIWLNSDYCINVTTKSEMHNPQITQNTNHKICIANKKKKTNKFSKQKKIQFTPHAVKSKILNQKYNSYIL